MVTHIHTAMEPPIKDTSIRDNPVLILSSTGVTVLVLCVCLSVSALAASASVETSKQRYSRLFLGRKTFRSKVMV